jgi:hypothetical protein
MQKSISLFWSAARACEDPVNSDIHCDVGKLRPELVQARHKVPDVITAHRDGDAALLVRVCGEAAEGAFRFRQEWSDFGAQPLAGGGEDQGLRPALEQGDAEDFLQPVEFRRYGGGGEPELGRGRAQASLVSDNLEGAQLAEIEILDAHGHPCSCVLGRARRFGRTHP